MMITDSIEATLHDSQAMIQLVNANVTYCAWPRGGGKTGGGIGPRILHINEIMPQSQVLLFSDTYERLMDRIVPNICYFLQSKLGWVEGEDYVKYKRPPDDWDKPIIPLDKFDKVISTREGLAICLVSLAVEGSGNAYNAVTAIGDETKFCDEEQIDAEVIPALRGCEDIYGHLAEYLSVWMFTDKWGPKIKWFLKKEKLCDKHAVETVYVLQCECIRLQELISEEHSESYNYTITQRIKAIQEKLTRIRKDLVYYSNMKPYENLATLGKFFFKRAKRIAKSKYVYNVAYLNYDPTKIEHTFYPTFTDGNKYSGKKDYDPGIAVIGAFDYNWRFSPLPVIQISKIEGNNFKSLNVIDYIYKLYPDGLEDTIDAFCSKYKDHRLKVFHYVFDHTAILRNPGKKSLRDIVVDRFRFNKWIIVEHYINKASDHDIRFEVFKKLFIKRNDMSVLINADTCDQLIKSIEQTPAVTSSGKTQKDKRSEKNMNFPSEDSTHGAEALDQILWGVYEKNLDFSSDGGGMEISLL